MESGYWPYITIIILLAFSAFFSASEIAYASANRLRLKKAAENGGLRAKAAYYIYENYNSALSAILIGNNLVNIAASAVATVIAISIAGEAGAAYSTLIITVLILIFGEIVPKIVAKEHSDAFSNAVSLPLRALMLLLTPVVVVVVGIVKLVSRLWEKNASEGLTITEEELAAVIEAGEDEGVIDEEKSDLLQSAIEFSEISVEEIMTHRVDMLTFDIDDDFDSILKIVEDSPYSRIPVYEGSIDNIIGVLYLNKLFKGLVDNPDVSIRPLLSDACFIHKTVRLPMALAEMKRRKKNLAIIIDEFGGTMGLVTLEDILEQLVGDIWDETDEILKELTAIGNDTYEVSGDMGIYDFFDELGIDTRHFESEYTTVGGWAIEMLNGFPHEGDTFTYENLTVTVKKMEDYCVEKLSVRVNTAYEQAQ